MKSKIYGDERDYEVGGVYYSGPEPSDREREPDDEFAEEVPEDVDAAYGDAQDDGDGADDPDDACDDYEAERICLDDNSECIGIAAEVLKPTTAWIDPVTAGYVLSRLAGLIAKEWKASRRGQTALFDEGVAHMSPGGVLGAWTPSGVTPPAAVSEFSNSHIEVDALSLGKLLARGRDKCSLVWMDGFHAIHFESGIAILDTEERLHAWLPHAC